MSAGPHSEVELNAPELGWKGFADFINISGDECEVLDFKTGVTKSEHEFQVRVYALLWSLDPVVNPRRLPATTLTIAYVDNEVDVPAPSQAELQELRTEIQTRTAAALAAVASVPPEARPAADRCSFCQVRQLCDMYWAPETQSQLNNEAERRGTATAGQYIDLQVGSIERRGPTSWSGVIESSRLFQPGTPVSIHANKADAELLGVLGSARRLRILDAYAAPPAEDWEDSGREASVTVSTQSEAFTV